MNALAVMTQFCGTYDEIDAIVEKIADNDDSIIENVVKRIYKDYYIIDRETISNIFKDLRSYRIYQFLYKNSERTDYNELKNYADNMYFMLDDLINLFEIEEDD